jgi:hypothetical protein
VSLLFEFVQFEFTHAIGPPVGRYLVERDGAAEYEPSEPVPGRRRRIVTGETRGVGVADVLVVGVTSAPALLPRLRRKGRDVESAAPPNEVPLSLVTFVKGTAPLDDAGEAQRRFEAMRSSEEDQQDWVDDGLEVLNRAIRAYRAGAHDPYVLEVARRDTRRVRIGYGTTDEVQEGEWRAAFELAPPIGVRSKRAERLRPSEAVATVLSGRGRVLEAEDVILRALVDLDHGRTRAAAHQVRAAMNLFVDELGPQTPSGHGRPDLATLAGKAEQLAAAAAHRSLDDAEEDELEQLIDAMDDLVDAWRYEATEE